MTSVTDPAAPAAAALAGHAPGLVDAYHAALPRALDSVGRKLLGAAWREDIGRARAMLAPARRYGFDRVDLPGPVRAWPHALLDRLGIDSPVLAEELVNACVNLAVAYARRPAIDAELRRRAVHAGVDDLYGLAATLPGDEQVVLFERLATEGHNLHPCGRTRLGWRVPDLLAHDLESPATEVGFVAVREDLHIGDDVGRLLSAGYPALPAAPTGYRVQPVHAWQLDSVLPDRYPELFADRSLLALPGARLSAAPTTALRTVLLEPDAAGVRRYLKLSLDIQVTSTRRSISIASTRNGPAISALLHRLTEAEPDLLLMPETAGAAAALGGGRDRDLSVIVRGGLTEALRPGEVAVPGPALVATSPVSGRSVLGEALARSGTDPLDFLTRYARLLLHPLLRLAAAGVGFEAHLQNSIPIFRDGLPSRIAFRDFAGLRLHLPRLAQAPGGAPRLWPGSAVGTGDLDVMRAKLGYTAVQAHLGELVLHLGDRYGVAERDAWRAVRAVLAEPCPGAQPQDIAFLTAPTVPHKALTRMRLAGKGDYYVPVHNPLHGV